MKEILMYKFLGIEIWKYFAALVSIVGGFALQKLSKPFIAKAKALAAKSKVKYDDMVVYALEKPIQWFWVAAGFAIAINVLPLPREPWDIERFVNALFKTVFIGLTIWFCLRLVDALFERLAEKAKETESRLDDQLVPIARKGLKGFLIVIGVVLLLQNLGYSVGSLVASLGIGGAAVALASKDTIANLFGSIVVFLDRPFQIGDTIKIGDIEGTVEEVGIRTTRIRTFEKTLVTVPNAIFTSSNIDNWSRRPLRRIRFHVGLTYSTTADQMEQARDAIIKIIKEDPDLDDYCIVRFDNFGPSSLDILVQCYSKKLNYDEYMEVKERLMLNIMRAVAELGLDFAFPTQTIHVAELPQNWAVSLSMNRNEPKVRLPQA